MELLKTTSTRYTPAPAADRPKSAHWKPQEPVHERLATALKLRVSSTVEGFRTPKPVSFQLERWLEERPEQMPWSSTTRPQARTDKKRLLDKISAVFVRHKPSCPMYSVQARQMDQDHPDDDKSPPDEDYKTAIRPLILHLYQLCSAGDPTTQQATKYGDSPTSGGNGSTRSDARKKTSSAQKRKRSASKLPLSDGEDSNHNDENDADGTPPLKKRHALSVQELASHFGCWFYKRAPNRYPLCASEHGPNVLDLRKVSVPFYKYSSSELGSQASTQLTEFERCFEKHQRRGDIERENIDVETFNAARGARCAFAITGPLRAEEMWRLTYMKLWKHTDRHTVPSPYFLHLGPTSTGWADRAAAAANSLEPHASPGLLDQLLSWVARAHSHETEAHQGFQNLLSEFESQLLPELLPNLQNSPRMTPGQRRTQHTHQNSTTIAAPPTASTRLIDHNARQTSEALFNSSPSLLRHGPFSENALLPMASNSMPSSSNIYQLPSHAALPPSQFVVPEWLEDPLSHTGMGIANASPLRQQPPPVTIPAPEHNDWYASTPSGYGGYQPMASAALTAADAAGSYPSVVTHALSQTHANSSSLFCTCRLHEYHEQSML